MNGSFKAVSGGLTLDYVPAMTQSGKTSLFLIHGWGNTSSCWDALLPQLARDRDVYRVDLPGFGANADCQLPDLEQVLASLGALLPDQSILVGWSLGGNLALRLATQYPDKVAAVATLATNVSFVANTTWPHAMAPAVFADFCRQFEHQPALTLKRFCGLEAQGDSQGRDLLKQLREQCQPPASPEHAKQWRSALEWLAQLNHVDDLAHLPVPLLHLFGEADALVPVAAAKAVGRVSPGQVHVLPKAGHALALSQPQQVLRHLRAFLAVAEGGSHALIDKFRMASSFSRAAATYDQVAHVQGHIGRRLLARVPPILPGQPVLDLGCGTGFCTTWLAQQNAAVTALDIAPGMLLQARSKVTRRVSWVCGDAEALPFGRHTFSGVVSNLTVQWSEQLPGFFRELADALTANGWFLFSTLGPDTLHELRAAWNSVDGYAHVNRFAPTTALQTALNQAGLVVEFLEEERVVPEYDCVQDLMRELKALGAHNANRRQNRGLTGPRQLRQVADTYEQYRRLNGKLPATYQVFYLLARKL